MKLVVILLTLITTSCNYQTKKDAKNPIKEFALYSDYFVFIADDNTTPLVIPLDLNWNPNEKGYEIEFKAWYGTKKDWPISYAKEEFKTSRQNIPQESFQHTSINGFSFNQEKKEITLEIKYAPEVTIVLPDKDTWILAPSKNKFHKKTFACKTSIKIKNKTKSGWIIYERIRWEKEDVVDFGDFETFFWIPLISNGDLYHFEQNKSEKTGFKWSLNNGNIKVNEISDFEIEVTQTINDSKSGRDEIPKEINISSEKNNLDISLISKGEQVGYGKKFPKGLAFYRQSLLVSNKKSKDSGYGMMELILEKN